MNVPLLGGRSSNAMFILSRVCGAMKKAKIPTEEITAFTAEAKSGDYDHLLQTVLKWVNTDEGQDEDEEYLQVGEDEDGEQD